MRCARDCAALHTTDETRPIVHARRPLSTAAYGCSHYTTHISLLLRLCSWVLRVRVLRLRALSDSNGRGEARGEDRRREVRELMRWATQTEIAQSATQGARL